MIAAVPSKNVLAFLVMPEAVEPRRRLAGLDLLRAVAVLLVLGRHIETPLTGWNESVAAVVLVWERGGWIGVDLFFVLSGFLVSGLLFSEYQNTGSVSVSRFLVRRGLKIYPAFYCFVGLTLLVLAFHWKVVAVRLSEVVSELFFIQSYIPSVWGHTWSLAVEEHFYLLCAGLIFVLTRIGRGKSDPYRGIPVIYAVLATLALAARVANANANPFTYQTHLYPTHLRLDGLMFGVLLSYLWHFKRHSMEHLIRGRVPFLAVLGVAMLTPAFLYPLETTPLIGSGGLSIFSLGSGLLVASVLETDLPGYAIFRWAAALGRYSYSIYLWHFFVLYEVSFICREHLAIDERSPVPVLVYFVSSVIIGVVMSKIVEYPVLRFRDRVFPSVALTVEPSEIVQESSAVVAP